MSSLPNVKFRVALCGGGISGLSLAVALSRYPDIKVGVYEAAERFSEIGAGVMVWSKIWRILELLGLSDDFAKVAHAPPDGSLGVGFDYRRSDQPEEGFRFHLAEMPCLSINLTSESATDEIRFAADGCIRFHRAHFLDVFVNHLPDGIAHFGKRLTSYVQEGVGSSIALNFSDGTSATCDILIGCDGIKSIVREQMLRHKAEEGNPELLDHVEPIWSGTIAYRGLIPVERLPIKDGRLHRAVVNPMMYCGQSKHIVAYSIMQRSVVNVVALVSDLEKEGTPYNSPWVTECSKEELLSCYAGWEPEVEELLSCIDKPTRWGIHQLRPLPSCVHDRVVLVGDAAHAMVPHQGAGAGQAIEDTYLLANILGDPSVNMNNITSALLAYEQVRLPMANDVLLGSRESGMMYEFNSEYGDVYEELGPAISRQWNWISETTPEADTKRAMEVLGSIGKYRVRL